MSETPSLTGALSGLSSLLTSLKGIAKSAEEAPSLAAASTPKIARPVCAWSSAPHDGDLALVPYTRLVTDGSTTVLVEKATSRAAMGEPIWQTFTLDLAPDALAFLASASLSDQRARHLAMIVRTLAFGSLSPEDVQSAAQGTLSRLGLEQGTVLLKNEKGFCVGTSPMPGAPKPNEDTKPVLPVDTSEAVWPEIEPTDHGPSSETVERAEIPHERLRMEWLDNDAPRKLVYDPRAGLIRYYQDATTKPLFVLPAHCDEGAFVALAEALKRIHA